MFLQNLIVFLCVCASLSAGSVIKPLYKGGRIVGGNETTIDENPWQVSIQLLGIHSCGGSLIGPDTVVTAAHCIDAFMSVFYSVVIGSTALSGPDAIRVGIKSTVVHEGYTGLDFDIGIIKLVENVNFTEQVQTVKLPEQAATPPAGTEVIVTGWGVTSSDGIFPPDVLRGVSVNIVDHAKCAAAYEAYETLTDRMVCAAVPEGGKDACQGDSGGPLTKDGTLFGIVSWGMGCGLENYPGVYTDVSSLRDWIKEQTGI